MKPLGALVVIDQGETDWKVIAVDITDPIASMLRDIDDVERCLPGFLDSFLRIGIDSIRFPRGRGKYDWVGWAGEGSEVRFAVLCCLNLI